jgi:hypothetical protein
VNDLQATARLAAALDASGIPHSPADLPMRASEDFGRFGAPPTKAAMVFLGAGAGHPALHNPDHDFPDALIPPGLRLWAELLETLWPLSSLPKYPTGVRGCETPGASALDSAGPRADIPPMSLPNGFLDEIRTRVTLSTVVGRRGRGPR